MWENNALGDAENKIVDDDPDAKEEEGTVLRFWLQVHDRSRLYPRFLQTIYRQRKRVDTLVSGYIFEFKEGGGKRTSYQRFRDLSSLDGAVGYVCI